MSSIRSASSRTTYGINEYMGIYMQHPYQAASDYQIQNQQFGPYVVTGVPE